MKRNPSIIIFSFFGFLSACGVKGMPQPPQTAPVLGRGEPNFSKATEKVKLKKKASPPSSDWDDTKDFPEEPGP